MRNNGNCAHTGGSMSSMAKRALPDIKPQSQIAALRKDKYSGVLAAFPVARVAPVVGMATTFIRKVCGRKQNLTVQDVLLLLEQDAFRETVVPRSMVLDYLLSARAEEKRVGALCSGAEYELIQRHVLDQLSVMPAGSVQCVVTSTPYWALRV